MPESRSRRRPVVWIAVGLSAVLLLVVGVLLGVFLRHDRTGEPEAALSGEIEALRRQLDRRIDERFKDFDEALRRQREEGEKEFARAGPNERERFAALFEKYRESVLLLWVEVTIRLPDLEEPLRMGCYGTGFVADESGLCVTNKHVVEPWKADPEVQALLLARPQAVIETEIHAWPSGARFLDSSGRPADLTGWHTGPGGLRLVGEALDEWLPLTLDRSGTPVSTRVLAHTNADLAVFALPGGSYRALPLKADPTTLSGLDPVLLLGFPLGTQVLEAGRADASPSLGTVRFVRETVSHTAPAFPGNSGGPLIAMDGEVVGVLTRAPVVGGVHGAETFSMAIRSDAVAPLLAFARSVRAGLGGTVAAFTEEAGLEVPAPVAGRVQEALGRAGDPVAVGDPLLRIDGADASAEVARAEAILAQAEVRRRRCRTLFEQGLVSRDEMDVAEEEWRKASSARDAARNVKAIIRAPAEGHLLALAEAGELLPPGAVSARILRTEDVGERMKPEPLAPGRRYFLLALPQPGFRFAGWSDGRTAAGRIVAGGAGGPFEARFERE